MDWGPFPQGSSHLSPLSCCHDELYLETVSQNKPSLLELLLLGYFVTATGQIADTAGICAEVRSQHWAGVDNVGVLPLSSGTVFLTFGDRASHWGLGWLFKGPQGSSKALSPQH